MRFAYIDSQGNEVPIPSIDALALRIELGAVRPDTQLYDAHADHWGPAHTHEIFHSLSRDAEGEGFMAPPPPVAAAPPTSGRPAAKPAPEAPSAAPVAEEEEEEEGAGVDFDLGLTLAEPPPGPPEDAAAPAIGGFRDLDLDLDFAEPSLAPSLVAEPEPSDSGGGGFDFGDLGSGLELEGSLLDDDAPATDLDFSSPVSDLGGGGDDLQLEQPMSSFSPESPPGWIAKSGADEVMDFSAVTAEEEADHHPVAPVAEVPARQRKSPKDRPSAPKFKSQRSLSAPIVLVVVLLALGVGGYVGWPMLSARLAERSAPDRPPVMMPTIPEELLPQMRSLGQDAIADVVSQVSESTRVPGAPAEPDGDWLAGVYLGNASRFASIEAFWSSIEDFMEGMRAAEWQLYHDKYVERVGREGMAAETAAQLTERADSGFVAAQPQREQAYTQMETLAEASLALHDFLLENEDRIEHRPGVTSATDPNVDPVLEIAASEVLRSRMLQMFDDITDSLEALGSLDRVTRERLTAALTARLQQVGIQ